MKPPPLSPPPSDLTLLLLAIFQRGDAEFQESIAATAEPPADPELDAALQSFLSGATPEAVKRGIERSLEPDPELDRLLADFYQSGEKGFKRAIEDR